MDVMDLEMFLTIVRTRSISKTADTLFLSQPTISHRLKAMEKELDFSLILRSKGLKQIELTPEGNEFIPIAQRMVSLWKETRLIRRERNRLPLSIGCADSVNTALLASLYEELIREDSPLDLNISTRQSTALYSLLDNHDIDVGFVCYHLYNKNIICKRVFQERLYLVQSSRPAVPKALVHTEELDPSKELFQKWDDRHQLWHDQWLSNYARPYATVDTVALIKKLWHDDGDCWMIAPESVVYEFSHSRPIYVSRLENAPPDRCYYKITHRAPLGSSERALAVFEEKLTQYLIDLRFDIPFGEVWQSP